ncbi:MAG: hypothetical protein E8D42_06855 [Nitrospira sp.]|nr:MAG: hypothetical protein E8D42_06855 [Nitrospira sp.]
MVTLFKVAPLIVLVPTLLVGLLGCPGLVGQYERALDRAHRQARDIVKLGKYPSDQADSGITKKPSSTDHPVTQEKAPIVLPPPSRSRNATVAITTKCETVLNWLGQLEREYPREYEENVGNRPGNRGKGWAEYKYANLFRDKYFVPVFGIPYGQLDDATRSSFYTHVTSYGTGQCGSESEYEEKLRPYQDVLSTAFSPEQTSYAHLAKVIAAINGQENQMNETLKQVDQFSATDGNLAQLLAELLHPSNPGTEQPILRAGSLSLWPSEISSFREAVKGKAQAIASELLRTVSEQAQALAPSLANAYKIKDNLSPKANLYVSVLDHSSQARGQQNAMKQQLDSFIGQALEEEKKKLASIPNTWGGLDESLKWYTRFQGDFEGFGDSLAVQTAQDDFNKKRQILFQSVKSEFQARLTALTPPTPDNMAKAKNLLQSIFPLPHDRELPAYNEYQTKYFSIIASEYLKRLRAIPKDLSGAAKLNEWKIAFKKESSDFQNLELVQSTEKEWDTKRTLVLKTLRAEFIKKQQLFGVDRNGLKQATILLDSLFPFPADHDLPMFKDYEQIVLKHPAASGQKPLSWYDNPPSPLLVSGLNEFRVSVNAGLVGAEKSLLAIHSGTFWVFRELGDHERHQYFTEFYVQHMIYGFIAAYSEQCANFLPPDAKTFQHIKTIYVGSTRAGNRETNYYKDVPGLLVKMRPQYHELYSQEVSRTGHDVASKGLPDRMQIPAALITQNGCQSEALRRFEDNLVLLATKGYSPVEALDVFNPKERALPQLIAYADRLNLAHTDITQAMMNGQFNPNFHDVTRAYLEIDLNSWVNRFGKMPEQYLRDNRTPFDYFRPKDAITDYNPSYPRVKYEQLRQQFLSRHPERYFQH